MTGSVKRKNTVLAIILSFFQEFNFKSNKTELQAISKIWALECEMSWIRFINYIIITPHTQRERGKVIGVGVHMCVCLWTKTNLIILYRLTHLFKNSR